MVKPTLMQSLLGLPSQTYNFPQTKDYYSSKPNLVRAANSGINIGSGSIIDPDANSITRMSESLAGENIGHVRSSYASSYSTVRSSLSDASSSSVTPSRSMRAEPPVRQDSNHHLIRATASSSLSRNAIPPSESYHIPSLSLPSRQSPPSSQIGSSNRRKQTPPNLSPSAYPPPPQPQPHQSEGEGDEEEEGTDVFYTPRSSLYSSVSSRTSLSASTAMIIDPKAIVTALLPSSLEQSKSTRGTRTPSDSSTLSFSSSASSSDYGDDISMFSSSSKATTSTRITSPVGSDFGSQNRAAAPNNVETITIASSSTSNGQGSNTMRGPRPLAQTATKPRRRSANEARRLKYTDEDWAKDVRWLGPSSAAPAASNKRPAESQATRMNANAVATRTYVPRARPQPTYPPAAKSAETRRRASRRHSGGSRGSRSSRGRMSALLEEDESEDSDFTPGASSAEVSRAPSPVQEEEPQPDERPSPQKSSPLKATVTRSASLTSSHTVTPRKTTSTTTNPPVGDSERTPQFPALPNPSPGRDGTRQWFESSSAENPDDWESPDARLQAYARGNGTRRRSYSNTRPLSRSNSIAHTTQTSDTTTYTNSLPTFNLPTPLSTTTSPANGYTGLTLPVAGYSSNGKADVGDGKIDLARAGIAQTTMATVEIVRGVAEAQSGTNGSSSSPRKKRRTLSISLKFLGTMKVGKGKHMSDTPTHLLDALPLPVAFTAHLPPPSNIPSSHILVQVFAVGLDALDSLLVHDKLNEGTKKSAGYIPGRSLAGRVIECGWEVKGDVCKKGEWVIALLDVKKSGALSEFIVVERHRVHRAPQPRPRPTSLFPPSNRRSHVRSASLPQHMNSSPSHSNPPVPAWDPFSIEELALLPLCALSAHRAIRTFSDVIASSKPSSSSGMEHQPRTILILQGHDGPGGMAAQMLSRRGVRIVVQVPASVVHSSDDDSSALSDEETRIIIRRNPDKQSMTPNSLRKRTLRERVEARLRNWGVEELCIGEPLEVLQRLLREGCSFDAILDTVGGSEVWELSQKLLLTDPPIVFSDFMPTTPVNESPKKRSMDSRRIAEKKERKRYYTQFTTLVGHNPDRPIPSAHDNLLSGFRSLRRTDSKSVKMGPSGLSVSSSRESFMSTTTLSGSLDGKPKVKRIANYAWINVTADVDFEGEDIRDSLGVVVGMVEEGWIRPWIKDGEDDGSGKIVSFDKCPEVFRRDSAGPVGILKDGGTCVVKIK
ncbi:hypothetical protein C8Q75DRAFT_275767 [Abortiporus biennis]|nr:hypothetical protein C8Q75DRAFT_275767 [Abortiporus biennis]